MVQLIDGKQLAAALRLEIKQRALTFKAHYNRQPGLAVILVGNNPASEIYVSRKMEACVEVGIHSILHYLDKESPQENLIKAIHHLNSDPNIDGILLQLPLPDHLDTQAAVAAISPAKDVDGLHPYNQGLLAQGRPVFVPCTPQGCAQLIHTCCDSIEGANVVIVGRSILVGRPLALLLTNMNATVTLAHTHTVNLKSICADADILVVAVGKPGLITGDYIKPGAIVIDVGINRCNVNGKPKLVGDVDFESASQKAAFITPVPGGVGPMTIANLLLNTIKAAELSAF